MTVENANLPGALAWEAMFVGPKCADAPFDTYEVVVNGVGAVVAEGLSEPNARLIAAAPELRDSLARLLRECVTNAGHMRLGREKLAAFKAVISDGINVLNKAGGA